MNKDNNVSDRLRNPDEIFTPPKIVNIMISQPEINKKVNDITSTFLEPSAGDGAFLVELLKRRMQIISDQELSDIEYGEKSLLALSSLYGIELLSDNVNSLINNMIKEFIDNYSKTIKLKFNNSAFNDHVVYSARTIINANMVQGDALKGTKNDGNPIIISEWSVVRGDKIKRIEYTFNSIINNLGPINKNNGISEQLDLFSENTNELFYEYKPVNIVNVYKEQLIKMN